MKTSVKSGMDSLAHVLILPAVLSYQIECGMAGVERAFPSWSQWLGVIPGMAGVFVRRAFYQWVFPRCGNNTWIGFGVCFSHPTAEIGHSVYIGPYCCLGDVTLEDDVLLGTGVSIMNGNQQHGIERLDVPIREQPGVWPRVTIGRDSWVGDRAIIMANVGSQCVIGAGSVVTKPIPDRAIAVGNPARIVRMRDGSAVPTTE